jgi:hypothetical protein
MQIFAIIGVCALCALAGFVAGCIAACYDQVEFGHTDAPHACGCPDNPANYGERAAA